MVVKPTGNSKAILYFYENGQKLYESSANIGRNGVALEGQKREGDGKTPSGIYKISSLFSYDEHNATMPLIKADKNIICVDDVNSPFYNRIIDMNENKKEYSSFEFMRRDDELYRYGALIDYNPSGVKNLGSCIFLHIRKNENAPTAGCIALDEKDMKTIFFMLDNRKKPIIIIAQDSDDFAKILKEFSLTH